MMGLRVEYFEIHDISVMVGVDAGERDKNQKHKIMPFKAGALFKANYSRVCWVQSIDIKICTE